LGWSLTGAYNATNSSSAVFQTVGAGAHYLAQDSPYRNVGTTNIAPTLLSDLRKKTTYPPIIYSNMTFNSATTLAPQAQRDTDVPDLGYHYDPLDYIPSTLAVTNATLTISPGTALGFYHDSAGIWLQERSAIKSVGTPTQPNWLVRYTTVQEQPVVIGEYITSGLSINGYHTQNPAPNAEFRFSHFSIPAGSGYQLYHNSGTHSFSNLTVQDCEFWTGNIYFGGSANTAAVIQNNLFHRASVNASANFATNISFAFSNNLVWKGGFTANSIGANSNAWKLYNNVFDSITNSGPNPPVSNGNNAYVNCNRQLNPTNVNNILLSSFTYAVGPLGHFYQNATNLINKGSTTANLNGLYHYTVITNLISGLQIKETNSLVDIGYHYVAVDEGGTPLDYDGDGIPNYIEDFDGDDVVDSGETDWRDPDDMGLRVWITRPKGSSIIP
jgi:hypothetical protein